jgi:hypothetical protein
MKNTTYYYEAVRDFRQALRDAGKKYDDGVGKIERLRGSRAFDEELAKLNEVRSNEVQAAQAKARKSLDNALAWMREAATTRPMIPPTAEALSLLQVLKMRESISGDELTQAARTLKDSPVSLSVLDELAQKHGHLGLRFGMESTDSILKHIQGLSRNAAKICKMEAVDQKRKYVEAASVHSPNYRPNALELVSVDRDFQSERDCLAWLGGVVNYEDFSKAVNDRD